MNPKSSTKGHSSFRKEMGVFVCLSMLAKLEGGKREKGKRGSERPNIVALQRLGIALQCQLLWIKIHCFRYDTSRQGGRIRETDAWYPESKQEGRRGENRELSVTEVPQRPRNCRNLVPLCPFVVPEQSRRSLDIFQHFPATVIAKLHFLAFKDK